MGKAAKATAEQAKANASSASKTKAAAAEAAAAEAEPDALSIITGAVPPTAALIGIAWGVGGFKILHSANEGRTNFLVRLIFYLLFDAAFARTAAGLCVLAARWVARRLPGAVVPATSAACAKEEATQHDKTLVWPPPGAPIPAEWASIVASRKRKQPYFLNHVRGCVRLRQAAQRVGAAAGTLAQVFAMSMLLDDRPLSVIGLRGPMELLLGADLWLGLLTGATCVLALFVVELSLGWLKIIGFCEVVVPGESLTLNLLWDGLFHAGVAINEEVSMRGWMLLNLAHCFVAHFGVTAASAGGLAVAFQSALVAVAHLNSPGASTLGLVNLMIGGVAGALNVFLSGGIAFALGWHFGWNILMGHLLGLSTSGIPMSAKLVSVVPHPDKAKLHGGQFGPEQSPLAPAAYLLGCAMLVYFYEWRGLEEWRLQLSN